MHVTERAAMLALLRTARARWSSIADDTEEAGSAIALLARGEEGQQALFSSGMAQADELLADADRDIQAWEARGWRFRTLLDSDYPSQLLTVHQRPPFIMMQGTSDDRDSSGVAIVGTRMASDRGIKQARELAAGLAERSVPVISGLAAGIDTAAHEGALGAKGRTVAVIGTGLSRAYPAENASLQARIATEGLVLSQFLPDSPPTRTSFPMRNATMSGYAAATVVVEAAWKSGARMQARLALQHGRPVILLDTLLEHDWAREYAKRPNTIVASGVADVLTALDALTAPRDELVWA